MNRTNAKEKSRHAGTIVGQGRLTGAKGHRLASLGHHLALAPLWDPRHLFEKFSFHPLPEPIFHRIIQISLSSNNILLVYTAYWISFVSYQCLKKDSIAIQKGHLCFPYSPKWKAGGALARLCPPLRRAWKNPRWTKSRSAKYRTLCEW